MTGAFVSLVVSAVIAWVAGAMYYGSPRGSRLGGVLPAAFVAATVLAFLLLPHRRRTLAGFFILFAGVVVW